MTPARIWHGATFVVVVVALVLQTILVVAGNAVLAEENVPPLGDRLLQLVSYFTIQANALVAIVCGMLMVRPDRDGSVFRVLRLDAVVGIAVTGLVHWFLLRPLLDLEGLPLLCDTLLHRVSPLLVVVGWLLFGPRPRVTGRVVLLALIWPVAWLAYTLVMGELTGFYPYPFVDVATFGYARVLTSSAGITVLFLALFALAWLADRKLPAAPRPTATAG